MRRKQRAHWKVKKSGPHRDWESFKRLQAKVQKSTRKSHRNYMEDVMSADLKETLSGFGLSSKVKDKKLQVS